MSEQAACGPADHDNNTPLWAAEQSDERLRVFAEMSGRDFYSLHVTRTGVLSHARTTTVFTTLTGYTPEEMDARG